jgi:hypothetical protein
MDVYATGNARKDRFFKGAEILARYSETWRAWHSSFQAWLEHDGVMTMTSDTADSGTVFAAAQKTRDSLMWHEANPMPDPHLQRLFVAQNRFAYGAMKDAAHGATTPNRTSSLILIPKIIWRGLAAALCGMLANRRMKWLVARRHTERAV